MEADPGQVDALTQLKALLAHAPSRQVGQAGNDLIDALVRQVFERAVARNHPEAPWNAARTAIEQADQAEAALDRAVGAKQMASVQREGLLISPWYRKHTLESPGLLVLTMLLIGAVMGAGFWFQRRTVLAVLGGLSILAAALLVLVAAMVQTEVERATADVTSGLRTSRQVIDAASTAARDALAADLEMARSLRGLWQCGRIRHPTAAFIPGDAALTRPGLPGPAVGLHQLAPNLSEPGNLQGGRYRGRTVYVGAGWPKDLAGKDLEHAAVLIDFDSDRRWVQAVQHGASLVLVVSPPSNPDGGGRATLSQAGQKITDAPLSIPRFYVHRRDLETAFGVDWPRTLTAGTEVAINQPRPGRWERREVYADWLLIPGSTGPSARSVDSGPRALPRELDPAHHLVHIQTYKDAMSVVPALSPGATAAANLVAALRTVRRFEIAPPRRPVLLSVVNDHTNALCGEQEFFYAAMADAAAIREELEHIDRQLARQQFIGDTFGATPTGPLIERLRGWRTMIGGKVFEPKSPAVNELANRRNRIRAQRVELGLEHAGLREQLASTDRNDQEDETADEARRRLNQLDERLRRIDVTLDDLVTLMQLFNRVGVRTRLSQLDERQRHRLSDLFDGLQRDALGQLGQYRNQRRRLVGNLRLRRRLLAISPEAHDTRALSELDYDEALDRRFRPVPAALVLTLDQTFGTDRVGLFYTGHLVRYALTDHQARQRVSRLARHALRVGRQYEQASGRPNLLEDTILTARGLPWQAHLGGRFAVGARVAHQYEAPALTLTGLQDMRLRAFTPDDTLDQIDQGTFRRVMRFTEDFVAALVDSEGLETALPRNRNEDRTHALELTVRLADEHSVSMSRITVPGALVMALPAKAELPNHFRMLGQVRPWLARMTNGAGRAVLRGSDWHDCSPQVFRYDERFEAIRAVLDFHEGERRFRSTRQERAGFGRHNLMAFEAAKVDLLGLTEPLTLAQARQIQVIDARQDAMPRRFASSGIMAFGAAKHVVPTLDATGSVFVEPRSRFKLHVGSGLVLNGDPEQPTGRGFDASVGILRHLELTGAADLWQLGRTRMTMLARKGVTDRAMAGASMDAAARLNRLVSVSAPDEAGVSRDSAPARTAVLVTAEEARGLAFRAYRQGLATINDLIRAVVIFMALVVPFCFLLMKLITPFTDINRQMALFAVIFAVTACLLHFVHPAFAVTQTPHVVILGFMILGLAVFVGVIIAARFNASMSQAVGQMLQSQATDAPPSRLAGVAFMVGTNNMKRRRIRASLTCATIVLVTFTMLSVISVSQDADPIVLRLTDDAPYSGLLFTRPGLAPISDVQFNRLRAQFERRIPDTGTTTASARVLGRVWAQRYGRYGQYLPYEIRPAEPIPGALEPVIEARVLLGMDAAEDGFTGPLPLVGGRWFSANNAPEVILSAKAASLLGVTPNSLARQRLMINGRWLEIVGLIDDDRFAALRDLSDLPLLPLLTAVDPDSARRTEQTTAQMDAEAAGSAALEVAAARLAQGTDLARAIDVALVPIEIARATGDGAYRVLAVKYEDGQSGALAARRAWQDANRLVRFQHARVIAGIARSVDDDPDARAEPPTAKPNVESAGPGDPSPHERGQPGTSPVERGQYAVASSSGAQVSHLVRVVVPLLLGGTIILNTMLAAAFERKNEIRIYSATGLNPTHIIMFFLAESFVFGVVGAVSGYLIGQILSLVIAGLGLIELNFNYSSLSVLTVIFLAIATVLLSTIYPAIMAARAAVPSGERRWSLPAPDGNEMHLDFPFSYDRDRVLGVCAYLRQFMQQNSEASSGRFLATLGPTGYVPASDGPADTSGIESEPGSRDRTDRDRPAEPPPMTYAMLFDVAPAPFDLGVNQTMELYAHFDRRVRAYMLSVHLTQQSGDPHSWMATNRPFLELLRKRLLGWRSQSDELQSTYHQRGEQLFAAAERLPTRNRQGNPHHPPG